MQYVDDASLNQIQKSVQDELDKKGKEAGVKFDYKDYTFNGQADQSTLNQIMTELVSDGVDIIIPDSYTYCTYSTVCYRGQSDTGCVFSGY